tara:strand:- start:12 stop:251 length:240 start_codon:yes stop_codon:yes gene_type:complete
MKAKKVYSVWESDWNGRDYPSFYEHLEDAMKHFNESKKDKPQYVSIRECWVTLWGEEEREIVAEDNIESYYSEDEDELT